jgi:hypothetical protein
MLKRRKSCNDAFGAVQKEIRDATWQPASQNGLSRPAEHQEICKATRKKASRPLTESEGFPGETSHKSRPPDICEATRESDRQGKSIAEGSADPTENSGQKPGGCTRSARGMKAAAQNLNHAISNKRIASFIGDTSESGSTPTSTIESGPSNQP